MLVLECFLVQVTLKEVVIKQPTTVAASSKDKKISALIQDLFMNDYLRVYTNNDLVGVELGGALKILLLSQVVLLQVWALEIMLRLH